MRVVSKDFSINVPYEGTVFCIISDDEKGEYHIGIRNSSLSSYMPMATYSSYDAAVAIMKDMADVATGVKVPNKYYIVG